MTHASSHLSPFIAVLPMGDCQAAQELIRVIHAVLGQPDAHADRVPVIINPQRTLGFSWQDGLTINIRLSNRGNLGQLIDGKDRTRAAHEAEALQTAEIAFDGMPAKAVRLAVLEMAGAIKGERGDPYIFNRQSFARRNVFLKTLLRGPAPEEDADGSEDIFHKMESTLHGAYSMLGVPPMFHDRDAAVLDAFQRVAGFTIIRVNDDSATGRQPQVFPILTLYDQEGQLRCMIWNKGRSEILLIPYCQATLLVAQGDHGRLDNKTAKQTAQAQMRAFFDAALGRLRRDGIDTLLFIDGYAARSLLPFLQNDILKLSGVDHAEQLDNVRVVRCLQDPDKLVHYYVESRNQPSGVFALPGQEKTGYCMNGKPPTLGRKERFSPGLSRHDDSDEALKAIDHNRRIMQMLEAFVMSHDSGDDPQALLHLTHRARGLHTAYHEQTMLPFPLHEAEAFRKVATR